MADPKDRPVDQEYGIGFLPDGKLNVVDAAEYRKRVMERDAEEALDNIDEIDEDFRDIKGESR